jgi:hypothetical protein
MSKVLTRRVSSYDKPSKSILLLLSVLSLSRCGSAQAPEGGPGTSSSKCLTEKVISPVQTAFQKLTPTFSPNGFYIQFKTGTLLIKLLDIKSEIEMN